MRNRKLDIFSAFRISPEICSSSTGTYFKTQSMLTHFIKSMFQKHQIVGLIWQYRISLGLWSSVILVIGLKCTMTSSTINMGHIFSDFRQIYTFKSQFYSERIIWGFRKLPGSYFVQISENSQFYEILHFWSLIAGTEVLAEIIHVYPHIGPGAHPR